MIKKVQTAMSETGQAVLPGTINIHTGDGMSQQHNEFYTADALADILKQTDMNYDSSDEFNEPSNISNYDDLPSREVAIQNRLGQWLDAFQCTLFYSLKLLAARHGHPQLLN